MPPPELESSEGVVLWAVAGVVIVGCREDTAVGFVPAAK